jgi:DNA-binding response OmpR family regulator
MLDSLLLHDAYLGRAPLLLVADDDEDILTLVQLRLSRSGFEVIVARDGEEALGLIRERRPDLAVLDCMMPKASGLDVLRTMRADSAMAEIPVVLLTARATDADVREGLDAGADDYIAKPFSPQELAIRVQNILGSERATMTPQPHSLATPRLIINGNLNHADSASPALP